MNLICDFVEVSDDRQAVTCSEAATWLAANGAVLCERHLAAARMQGWRGLQRLDPRGPDPAFIRRENRRAGEDAEGPRLDGPEAIARYEEGQGLAEYALILALIAVVAILALIFLGGEISALMDTVGQSI